MPDGDAKQEARKAQQKQGNEYAQQAQSAVLLEAIYDENQLREQLVWFWLNHFSVFRDKGRVRWLLADYAQNTIRPHALGKFRDLVMATLKSPAMLEYLDNAQNARDKINENYARELMELHTLGVDGGYTQQDVIAVARALTGWTIDQPRQGGSFVFRAAMHDRGEKIILGQRFPAGHGEDEGERVLDLLASHPATAHHIAFELAQRFIADEPPPAVVDRAAAVFLSSKGDLRAVVRSIVTSPEFFAPAAYRAKVKTPLEFVVSVARASGATVMNAQPLAQALRAELGMPLYGCQPPTGYSNTADTWVNTGALLNRMNFALRLVSAGGRAIRIDTAALVPDVSGASRTRLVDALLGGDVSPGTMAALSKAETPQQLLALALGSPEFQRR
jgi:uncharacterized protein (DUF1800 family)